MPRVPVSHLLALCSLTALGGCRAGIGFDGGALLTKLYVDNQSEMPLTVEWTVGGGNIGADGEVTAPAGERTLLLTEVDGAVLLPSEILERVTLRAAQGETALLEFDVIDDERWLTDSVSAVRAEYSLVIVADDLP